ncbi:PP2C family protein-serine/threonine phosphatase [Actinomycetospora termitidis]|uniref:PP2C family protein-serine/threonine phosphatase n=1 Tax=Actinomycetospora termitidis TaxID=3053470 RepID=A0ABT7MEX6_9PSEU|nr:PP2C family protein-serine/threonine phosphatase [Actinomycetospora sp. Odt1-22]MDL5159218.1 PP2C family protein-serine/threonine phosphatase [Actinomycetospora sp. Odt1-22]
MDSTMPAGAPSPTPPRGMRSLHSRVLAGLSEAVVVTGPARPGGAYTIVHAANTAAERLLPGITAGLAVERVPHDAFRSAVAQQLPGFEAEVAGRVLVARAERLDDDVPPGADLLTCWYLRDVTDERRGSASLQRAQARAGFLAESGRALHGVLNLERTLRTAASLAAGFLAPTVLVLLADGSDAVRWARADAGRPRPHAGEMTRVELRAAPRLHEALVEEAPVDPWVSLELAELPVWNERPTGRIVVVPVPGTVVRGVLVLVEPADDEDVVPLAEEYATRVGTALSAAALFREQAHLGHVLQASLEPPPLPDDTRGAVVVGSAYRPARESLRVGGDFYEVLPRTAVGRTPFLLGDVCGKGIEAAVLSGRVRQSLHALRLVEQDPTTLLGLLNAALLDAADLDAAVTMPRFATMVLGDAEPLPDGGLRLRLATGGHPPPFVVRADGTVEEVDVVGSLVGALRDAEFSGTEVLLAPGETCLIYSDGVTEARGGPGGRDFYGEERLAAALSGCAGAPAQVVCERVVQLLSDWLAGRDHDDVALLALQAPPRPRPDRSRPDRPSPRPRPRPGHPPREAS